MKNFFKKVPPRALAFALILSALLMGADAVLASAENRYWAEMKEVRAHPNAYDICILGPGTAMVNNANQELFEQYGIAGISLAEPSQPVSIARYALEEFLNYQSPQVVFLDAAPLFYSEEDMKMWAEDYEKETMTAYLDGIKSPSIRWKMLQEIQRYNDNVKDWDFISKLKYTHENWKTPENFYSGRQIRTHDAHGNDYLTEATESPAEDFYETGDPSEERPILARSEKYLSEIAQLCGEAGADLILLTEQVRFTKAEHNALVKLADKYGIAYLNINEHLEEIGFLPGRDLRDPTHFNLSGAVKVSDWLGKYLSERYEFTDKRTLPGYEWYWDYSAAFNEKKEYVSGIPFYEYLKKLAELDLEENAVFISAYDDAAEKLGDKGVEGLRALGLEADLKGNPGCCYAAVLHGSKVREEFDFVNPVTISGEVDGVPYMVTSGGSPSADQSHIAVDSVDYMQKGQGLNFVVYNIPSKQVTDSVFFNTHIMGNPRVEKNTDEFEPLTAEKTFRSCLTELAALDKDRYAVFLSVQDDAATMLGGADAALLSELGLKTDLRGQYRCSYAAVLHGGEVREKFSKENLVTLAGTVGDQFYMVTSGGLTSGGEAHIVVGGTDYIQHGRGFNFVVYDAVSGQAVESVSFDTYAQENPLGETKTTEFQGGLQALVGEKGDFRSYLMDLAELDKDRYAVFLSVQDEATATLNSIDAALMERLGLRTNLRGQYRCSYAAVLYNGEAREGFSLEKPVTLKGMAGGLPYKVTSGGLASGEKASIELNGKEYIQGGRGFNIVVCNLETGEVEESVYFDTYGAVNPHKETKVG